MKDTPQSNRLHVSIFGETNSGKSSLFNAFLGTDTAIVSEISGTTTDPISKSMELIPFGPIVLIDTAGINDKSMLGNSRIEKTKKVLDRTDYAIYTIDISNFDEEEFYSIKSEFEERKINYTIVITKKDLYNENDVNKFKSKFKNSYAISSKDKNSVEEFKKFIANELNKIEVKENSILKGLLDEGATAVLVIPIDEEAPKGRLILPQVQLIRDCLDNGIRCNVTTEKYLNKTLEESRKVDLVITDSQAFKYVSKVVPPEIPLTSFSILMARQKGDIEALISGVKAIKNLKDNSKVLIAEVCTHTKNHQDIGTVKIPNGLKKLTGKNFNFEFCSGRDFPEDIEKYDLIIHCGGCMATSREIQNRINKACKKNIPITNYGIVLAYISGILERSIEILNI